MTIKFLKAHKVDALPPEFFEAGQLVSGRSPESEKHFVSRGVAAYERDGKLFDIEGKEVVVAEVTQTVVISAADNRVVPDVVSPSGFGTMADGTPQRAASGPGEVVMTSTDLKPVKPARKAD